MITAPGLDSWQINRKICNDHHLNVAVKATGSNAPGAFTAPERFEPAVDTLYSGGDCVQPHELVVCARDVRKPTQVDRSFHGDGQAMIPIAVAPRVAGASRAALPRGAPIFQGTAISLVTGYAIGIPRRYKADSIMAVDRARVAHDVQGGVVASTFTSLKSRL